MRKFNFSATAIRFFTAVFALLCLKATAQEVKPIALEAIFNGTFRTERMSSLHSMHNGKQYSVLNYDRASKTTSIDIYDYKTLSKVSTLLDSKTIEDIQNFSDYTFSQDETKVLLATNLKPVFRHSRLGHYYVYDTTTKMATKISDEFIQEPTFSPNGNSVAFGLNNNLFVKNLKTGVTTQITNDGKKNKIINGITDWVYEEEFAFVRAFEWNAASNKIAFIKFDETDVPEFSMDVYGTALYQTQQVFKYPKAGEKNAKVSLHIYDLATANTQNVKVDKAYDDFYIPRIKWTNKPDVLSAQYMNRHQNELDLWMIDAKTNTSHLAIAETDNAYIDVTSNLTFLKDHSFIWTSEKDGYNHIYHYDAKGQLLKQITSGEWEVTNYYGYNAAKQTIYYQSVENGSILRDVYSIGINGKHKKRLSTSIGTNNADFSADFSYFINSFSSATIPTQYTLNSTKTGKVVKHIIDNKAILNTLAGYDMLPKEFGTITVNGNDLNMYTIKPSNFDESKSYPLLMFQYSGPGSQMVANRWHGGRDYWHQHLAQKGYIIVCVDGRGTGLKGAAFKKVTQKELGKYEVEDQIAAAKQLAKRPYIDAERIGIWGWSYGGFMSSNAILKGNDVFKVAIAVAPVTSWRFYDTIYTERYMTTPQENPSGYDDNSPINHVEKLKGDYLLIHGTADDNVHVQNTMRMVEALVQANKQFDWAIYPDKNHGIYGGNTSLHLYTKMTKFLDEKLGDKLK